MPDFDDSRRQIAEAMTQMLEVSQMLIETAAGYRAKCIEAGFTETAAEAMAVQFHSGLINKAMLSA